VSYMSGHEWIFKVHTEVSYFHCRSTTQLFQGRRSLFIVTIFRCNVKTNSICRRVLDLVPYVKNPLRVASLLLALASRSPLNFKTSSFQRNCLFKFRILDKHRAARGQVAIHSTSSFMVLYNGEVQLLTLSSVAHVCLSRAPTRLMTRLCFSTSFMPWASFLRMK
jgi:predicted dithiol-disulfide oxidoreductase (DUF899 family)